MQIDIEKAIEQSKEIIDSKGCVDFGEHSNIYVSATDNVIDTVALYGNNEKVLTVGGAGVFAYESIIHGAKDITLFDINTLQYLYYELLKLGITKFTFEQFIENFTMCIANNTKDKSSLLIDIEELIRSDDSIITEYWRKLLEIYPREELVNSALFNDLRAYRESLSKNASLYQEEGYEQIRQAIINNQVILKYVLANITELEEKTPGTYDLIMFDNILQFYRNIEGLDTIEKVHEFIQENIRPLLSEKGQVQVCYGHQKTAMYMLEQMGKLDPAYAAYDNFYLLLSERIAKFGIIPNLDSLSDDYSVDIIPDTSHSAKDSFAKHCVLSYKPKAK